MVKQSPGLRPRGRSGLKSAAKAAAGPTAWSPPSRAEWVEIGYQGARRLLRKVSALAAERIEKVDNLSKDIAYNVSALAAKWVEICLTSNPTRFIRVATTPIEITSLAA